MRLFYNRKLIKLLFIPPLVPFSSYTSATVPVFTFSPSDFPPNDDFIHKNSFRFPFPSRQDSWRQRRNVFPKSEWRGRDERWKSLFFCFYSTKLFCNSFTLTRTFAIRIHSQLNVEPRISSIVYFRYPKKKGNGREKRHKNVCWAKVHTTENKKCSVSVLEP